MKFNIYLPKWRKEFLEQEYKDYLKITPMTKKEQRALREWVKDGHSVFENTDNAWYDGQIPVEFLTVFRDEEYIRQHTKAMNPEDARKFALNYYGWDDDSDNQDISDAIDSSNQMIEMDSSEELPF